LFFFSLAIDLYVVFLLYTAATYCLKGEAGVSRIIFGIFAAFIVVLHFSGAGAFYVANKNPSVGFEHNMLRYQSGRLSL
jgi:DMSO/TMAO reductase YedYZ heme-binding membrane subunit